MLGGARTSVHLEIGIRDTPLSYATGDHVGIFPQNDPDEVERLGRRLGLADLDAVFTMTALDPASAKKHPFPCPTTYRTALTYYLDIMSVPRTHILKAMVDYAEDERDRARLLQLIGPDGKDALHRYLHADARHLLETLDDFPSVRPPVDLVFELLPRLQCRYYSISSSPKVRRARAAHSRHRGCLCLYARCKAARVCCL
jgi:NADPH-ferrihemoprotein reductase